MFKGCIKKIDWDTRYGRAIDQKALYLSKKRKEMGIIL